ncbi:MAG: tRNA (adenosine(37)-N6)-threonylcarbamoyltransferase complex dimerization subunit type 1 TsaB [Chitinophagaceae bacterium]|nr:tRNA (adenosine(37)-N6)-threonylcarbamoyltransferase complex dimerization subunit type 1 TsaB [Chitinophagaceae bacterium]
MAYLLYLDTSAQATQVLCIHNQQVLAERSIAESRDHGQHIHQLIDAILSETKLQLSQFDAFVVMNGPGSYTGLRIALSVAKGFCYALQKPLYLLHKLHVTAKACLALNPQHAFSVIARARAGEYFHAQYNRLGQVEAAASIKTSEALNAMNSPFYTFQTLAECAWESVQTVPLNTSTLAQCSFDAFLHEKPADLMYAEPFYLKNVYINKINKL